MAGGNRPHEKSRSELWASRVARPESAKGVAGVRGIATFCDAPATPCAALAAKEEKGDRFAY